MKKGIAYITGLDDLGEEPPTKPHDDLKDGFVHLGSPDQEPGDGFESPESRLHGGDTALYCCDEPMARTRK